MSDVTLLPQGERRVEFGNGHLIASCWQKDGRVVHRKFKLLDAFNNDVGGAGPHIQDLEGIFVNVIGGAAISGLV